MKKNIMIIALALGLVTLVSAGGKDEQNYGPGHAMGYWSDDAGAPEVETLKGTLQLGDYGHIEVVEGNNHYLLGREQMFEPELLDRYLGGAIEMEGFIGPLVFTKDKEEFKMFHPLKVLINGESLDLGKLGAGFGPGRFCDDDDMPMNRRWGGSSRGGRRGPGFMDYDEDLED